MIGVCFCALPPVRWVWALAVAIAALQVSRVAGAADVAGAAAANATTGETAPMNAEARALYEEGLGLYAARDFAAAIRRFEEGYAREPRREFLFAEAQAFRLAGDCAHAVPLYQRFLQTEPSSIQVDATRMGLDRCDKQDEAAHATIGRTPADRTPVQSEPAPAVALPRSAPDRPRWWLDPAGLAATGAGVIALGVGAGFIIASNDARDRANSPSIATISEYDRLYDTAEHRRTVGIIAMIGGGAALAGGLARLALVRHRAHAAEGAGPAALLTFVPSTAGGSLLWQGTY